MPSTMLPTPAPSTEIEGKRASFSHGQIDAAFALPPAAIAAAAAALEARSEASPSSSSTTSNGSDSSYRPVSPQRSGLPVTAKPTASTASTAIKSSAGTRRRSSATNQKQNMLVGAALQPSLMEAGQMYGMNQSYTLPPPPTRSRKIIQMKPRSQDGPPDTASADMVESISEEASARATNTLTSTQATKKGSASSTNSVVAEPTQAPAASSSTGTKRKQQAGPTTAAGRKIARKTAHSLIERRRRSKMNEEFAVLKDMIPACEGQDMHKLQVLSASIEYMRYLEQCLADLKTAHARCPSHSQDVPNSLSHTYAQQPSSHIISPPRFTPTHHHSPTNLEDSEMSDADTATSPQSSLPPSIAPRPMHAPAYTTHAPSVSPAILPSTHVSPALNASQQRGSYSQLYSMMGPAAVSAPYQYPGSAYSSQHPSPAFMPQVSSTQLPGYGAFRLNSPAISEGPQRGREYGSISGAAYVPGGQGVGEGKGRLETPDKEATAALMMLNTDRRSWTGASQEGESAAPSSARSGRGMSVRDLLSN